MAGNNEYIIPYYDSFLGMSNRQILYIKHGGDRLDRSFIQGVQGQLETESDAAIRIMRQMGGVDVSSRRVSRLTSHTGRQEDTPATWLAVNINPKLANEMTRSTTTIGQIQTISIWNVYVELFQIPDQDKGRELASFWNSTLFQLISAL